MRDRQQLRTRITAHAGSDGHAANTAEDVRYALDSAADAFEVDVRRGEGGVLALGHDEAGAGALALAQVFAWMAAGRPTLRINCDLKEAGLERELLALAREAGVGERLILSGTVDPACFAGGDDFAGVEFFWNVEGIDPARSARLYAELARLGAEAFFARDLSAELAAILEASEGRPYHALNMYHALWHPGLAASGPRFSLWTVDEEPRLRELLEARVYALTTRRLELALALRDEIQGAGESPES